MIRACDNAPMIEEAEVMVPESCEQPEQEIRKILTKPQNCHRYQITLVQLCQWHLLVWVMRFLPLHVF